MWDHGNELPSLCPPHPSLATTKHDYSDLSVEARLCLYQRILCALLKVRPSQGFICVLSTIPSVLPSSSLLPPPSSSSLLLPSSSSLLPPPPPPPSSLPPPPCSPGTLHSHYSKWHSWTGCCWWFRCPGRHTSWWASLHVAETAADSTAIQETILRGKESVHLSPYLSTCVCLPVRLPI